MAIADFNKVKKLDVESETDEPTISHAVPIKITSGDDSTTGTGEIVLDWTNISSESDIAVYDENDNLLDYWIESFDASDETATIHVYRDWVQDGSTQCQVAYGDGPSDQSVSASTVFDKEDTNSDLVSGWALNEDSGDALDLTSNDNDGTVNGTNRSVSGIVNGAYEFEKSNGDNIDTGIEVPLEGSLSGWFKYDGNIDSYHDYYFGNRKNTTSDWTISLKAEDDEDLKAQLRDDSDDTHIAVSGQADVGNWEFIVMTWSGSHIRLYRDGELAGEETGDWTVNDTSRVLQLAGATYNYTTDSRAYHGKQDDIRIYKKVLSSDEISAKYDASKSSPDFFSQQAAESKLIELTGTVDVDGTDTESVDVYAWNKTTGEFAGHTTTDSNGDYTLSEAGVSDDVILVAVDDQNSDNFGDEKSIKLSE